MSSMSAALIRATVTPPIQRVIQCVGRIEGRPVLGGTTPSIRADLICDRDRIRDRPIAPRSPWQNPYVERLIGTLRRECLDHVVIFGERHLRRVLTLYSLYYNESRTHLGLAKDAPLRRAVQRRGTIAATPILSGLHHHYRRI